MSTRNLMFAIVLLAATVLAGYFVDWYLALGMVVGAIILLFIFYRRYSVLDEIEAEINWQVNYTKYGYADDGSGEPAGRFDGFWRPLLLVIAMIATIAAIIAGLLA